ncbi:MAG: efflux RND transporter periplasmic adaptor subunit [Kordiimonadaceae bacterium]|nr:efflux RND transporter periplasmic adaptor subunit [Kordiimonadaceae bacterium]MBT6467646.1 efflux RND transporter periplasmic adaptor subunit [Kordiimonadaceae bacterium]MBT7606096.1 efflux RND transporter periplasmic adaptor subunit [Kordiimonadaceae bacterium]
MSIRTLIVFIALAALAAIGWYIMAPSPQMGPGAGQRPPVSVSVIELKSQIISREETLPGRITAFKQAEIRPQVNGIITQRLFEEGAYVEKLQPLYQIDDRPYRAALSSAQANLQSALATAKASEAKEERFKRLISNNTVSGQAYDDAKAEFDQAVASISIAEAAVTTAQVSLDYTRVLSPISGRIGKSSVTEGALVTTNQLESLSVITQLNPIYVDINQSGADAMRLRQEIVGKNIPVSVLIDKDRNIRHLEKGELKFSGIIVDETTGSIGLRAVVPNSNDILLPGLFVHAIIELGEQDVVLVPQRASTRQADGSLAIWILDKDNKAIPKNLVVSGSYQDKWIVTNGAEAGDTVIIEGYQKIRPNMTVSPSAWITP